MTKERKQKGLPEAVKLFIVRQLSAFETPNRVSELVKEEFGLDVPRNHIAFYDPEKGGATKPSAKLVAEFYRAREAHLTNLDDIPEAHKAVRVRHLADAARKAKDKGNFVGMAGYLEQIAKEVGGTFEGKRQVSGAVAVTGADGGPVEHEHRHTWNADEAVKDALGALAAEEG